MAIEIDLYKSTAERNKVNKGTDLGTALLFQTCDLKSPTSVIDPVIMLETSSNIWQYNYLYIRDLGRYYFINDIIFVRTGLYELHCHVDVLYTYKTEISGLTATLSRNENSYNNLIVDDRRVLLNDTDFTILSAAQDMFVEPTVAGWSTEQIACLTTLASQ